MMQGKKQKERRLSLRVRAIKRRGGNKKTVQYVLYVQNDVQYV